MRESRELSELSAPARLPDLLAEHGLASLSLGDQDWVNLVYWSSPHLVQPLPCSYNRQTDIVFLRPGTADQFHTSHACPGQVRDCSCLLPTDAGRLGFCTGTGAAPPPPSAATPPCRAGPCCTTSGTTVLQPDVEICLHFLSWTTRLMSNNVW